MRTQKAAAEDNQEEIVTKSPAAAKEIHVDAAVSAVLSELDGIFALKDERH